MSTHVSPPQARIRGSGPGRKKSATIRRSKSATVYLQDAGENAVGGDEDSISGDSFTESSCEGVPRKRRHLYPAAVPARVWAEVQRRRSQAKANSSMVAALRERHSRLQCSREENDALLQVRLLFSGMAEHPYVFVRGELSSSLKYANIPKLQLEEVGWCPKRIQCLCCVLALM